MLALVLLACGGDDGGETDVAQEGGDATSADEASAGETSAESSDAASGCEGRRPVLTS